MIYSNTFCPVLALLDKPLIHSYANTTKSCANLAPCSDYKSSPKTEQKCTSQQTQSFWKTSFALPRSRKHSSSAFGNPQVPCLMSVCSKIMAADSQSECDIRSLSVRVSDKRNVSQFLQSSQLCQTAANKHSSSAVSVPSPRPLSLLDTACN